VLGVTAVRGRVLPVADVRRLAGLGPADAAGTAAGAWLVVIDDGQRAAALTGLQVRRVIGCAEAMDEAPAHRAAALGLPVRGVVRLERDGSRGADALPPTAPLLDVAGLLDLVHEPTGAQP
jgi:chemotaxis signal transduction protein